ncbi:MAG TPA: hypothetical protein VH915_08915 [Pedococcus sp.]|jgi:hypothetical protein
MTSSVGAPDLLRTERDTGGWHVTAIECRRGLARVENRPGLTEVVVADWPGDSDVGGESYSAAACTPEGDALVMSRQAPPALLVTRHGQRPAPVQPGGSELLHLVPGQRLLLLSATAYDALPECLAAMLHGPSSAILDADPFTLLHTLFREIGAGSGAVIGRHAPQSDRPLRALPSV